MSLDPGSSYAAPFELLAACHERVARSLALLQRLVDHVDANGVDPTAAAAAADVLRYFDLAAPLHHEDEERHVFPAVAGDAALAPVCARLVAEHRAIAAQWALLRPLLASAAAALADIDVGALRTEAAAFVALHDAHLRTEDELVFPRARQNLTPQQRTAMSTEMAARRGLTLRCGTTR